MYYIVAYDIPNTKRRTRVFKTMRSFGKHSQFSVFECTLDEEEFKQMLDKIKKIIKIEDDKITIYPLCGNCQSKIITLGQSRLFIEEDIVVI